MFSIQTALNSYDSTVSTDLVFDDYADAITAAFNYSLDADIDRYPLHRITVVRADDNKTLVTFHQSDLRRN